MDTMNRHCPSNERQPARPLLSLAALARIIQGEIGHGATDTDVMSVGRIVTDSRTIQPGDVFWALSGPRFDGADFAGDAWAAGAAGVVSERNSHGVPRGCWSLQVDDTTQALTRLAAWHRGQFQGQVVAVTGSVGKTTTRQMIAAALSGRFATTSSPQNYNNEIGLPLSVLQLDNAVECGVFELAARRKGEIAALAATCRPRIGVITTVAESHLDTFSSRAAVADAKAELLDSLPADGLAVLNGDDPWLRRVAGRARCPMVWVGRGGDCDLIATRVRWNRGVLSFEVAGQEFAVPVWGRHHLTAALASVAVARAMGLSLAEIATALAGFDAPPMRCEVVRRGGVTVINDAYNASPASMQAALDLLRETETAGRRVVVCGDMRELGPEAEALHRWLGDAIVTRCGADLLLACGQYAAQVAAGARSAGMPAERVIDVATVEDALPELPRRLHSGDVVLLKGSRALALERMLETLERANADVANDDCYQETLVGGY